MHEDENQAAVINGTAAVQDGRVIVTDPQEGGKPALITPGQNVHIFVNGLALTGSQAVTSEDEIKVEPRSAMPDWQLETRISADKMNAYMRIEVTTGAIFAIADHPPREELLIEADLKEMIKPQPKVEEMIQILKNRGISFGLMPEMLQLAIDSEQTIEYLVAKGEPPVLGVDASIRKVFEEKKQADMEEGAPLIHYHEVNSVEPGELIAQVIPPQPGKSGMNVLGEPLLPPAPKNLILAAGKGVEINAEGTKAFALIAGRPVVKGHTISVSPTYTLQGDVDAKTGQIVFKGDVTIQGNVLDGMKVEASGKVIIQGYVGNATIIAGGDIIINNNLVGGTVRAGGNAAICQRLITNLALIEQQLKLLAAAAAQMKNHPSVAKNKDMERLGDGILVKMLLDTKFSQVIAIIKEIAADLELLMSSIESKELESFLKTHQRFSKTISARVPVELRTIELIQEFVNRYVLEAKDLHAFLQETAKERAKLSVPYVQNSHLESSGDVIITGKGCYSSNIYAGENVVIYGVPGVFRAGEIIAGGNVKVRELGSQAEAITSVQVKKEKQVSADRAYPGVLIKAGARIEKVSSQTVNLSYTGI